MFNNHVVGLEIENTKRLQACFDIRKTARRIDNQPRLMTGIAALHGPAFRLIGADNGRHKHAVKSGFHQFGINPRRQKIDRRIIAAERAKQAMRFGHHQRGICALAGHIGHAEINLSVAFDIIIKVARDTFFRHIHAMNKSKIGTWKKAFLHTRGHA